MSRPDDSLLAPEQLRIVQACADKLLHEAGAIGPKPTPIAQVLAAAKVVVVDDELIDENLLRRMLQKARSSLGTLKTALSKVLGLFEPQDRLVVIDRSLPAPRRPFILLHEAGHGFMPHQAKMYSLMQDCEELLNPDVTDLFEREANVFASEVLFQGEQFAKEAFDHSTSVKVPLQLAKRFGSSNYASFRRYALLHPKACALIALDPLNMSGERVGSIRRVVASKSFVRIIDIQEQLPDPVRHPHPLAMAIPQGTRRMSYGISFQCVDRNGSRRQLRAESFFTGHQILVLVTDLGILQPTVLTPRLGVPIA